MHLIPRSREKVGNGVACLFRALHTPTRSTHIDMHAHPKTPPTLHPKRQPSLRPRRIDKKRIPLGNNLLYSLLNHSEGKKQTKTKLSFLYIFILTFCYFLRSLTVHFVGSFSKFYYSSLTYTWFSCKLTDFVLFVLSAKLKKRLSDAFRNCPLRNLFWTHRRTFWFSPKDQSPSGDSVSVSDNRE